jgi:hypothetical protein
VIEAARSHTSVGVLRLLNLGKKDSGEDLKEIEQRPVFILSTGRTGTQFLAYHFDRDSHVRALHEPTPSRGLRFWTVAYLEGAVEPSVMTNTLRRYRTGFFDKITEPVYVESNNFLAGFAESLIEEFDEPTLIHVVRDPRTYVRSAINNGAASGLKGLANRLVAFAHLGFEPDSEHPTIRRSARYWTLLNKHLQSVGESYPAYHLFRYEDLFAANSDEFERLVEVVGAGTRVLDARRDHGRVNQSTRDVLPTWDDWLPAQQRVVIDTCGDLMAPFGYDT